MPQQLIFTSAPRGLVAGRSGYCTVARHRSIPDRLAQILESLGTPHQNLEGATFTFRIIEASNTNWFVLSRFVARGLDYSQRDNRLAHHLIFTAEEAAVLPPPSAIAFRWNGWLTEWTKEPTWLTEDPRPLILDNAPPLRPASAWREFSGTGAKAAWLVNEVGPATLCLTQPPEDKILLRLLAESASLLGQSAWYATFTTQVIVTKSDGFNWAVGAVAGRPEINLSQAHQLPAPTGELAVRAATGNSAPIPARTTGEKNSSAVRHTKSNQSKLPWNIIIAFFSLGILAIMVALVIGQFSNRSKNNAPPSNPTAPAINTTQSSDIYRSNIAIQGVASFLDSERYVDAGKLWLESVNHSPTFAERYREQYLTRITKNYAEKTAAQLLQRLAQPNLNQNTVSEIGEDAATAVRIGTELNIPVDANWKKLVNVNEQIQIISQLDIRPVILISGSWQTTDLGKSAPSSAEFKLSNAGAEKILKFIELTKVTSELTVSARVRLLPLTSFHKRDNFTPYLNAEIRRGGQSYWIETSGTAGTAPIVVGIGPKKKSLELNFTDGTATSLQEQNRILEIVLPDGSHQCIALIADWKKIKPLNLGTWALDVERDTGVVQAATWAENALKAFQPETGTVGLYPTGHEFPDRDLASLRATRSLLETDLLRNEYKESTRISNQESIKSRKQFFAQGDYINAGRPWSLIIVSPKGDAGATLIEFQ